VICDLIVNCVVFSETTRKFVNMLKKMKLTRKKAEACLLPVFVFLLTVMLPVITFAQAGFETSEGSAGPDTGVEDVPIDGGTVFLIGAGILFGVYRLYKIAQSKNKLALVN
jgi:hypothetical protein